MAALYLTMDEFEQAHANKEHERTLGSHLACRQA
jgi:hypothetical protein